MCVTQAPWICLPGSNQLLFFFFLTLISRGKHCKLISFWDMLQFGFEQKSRFAASTPCRFQVVEQLLLARAALGWPGCCCVLGAPGQEHILSCGGSERAAGLWGTALV